MSTSGLTPEEIKQIAQAKREYNEAFMNGSTTMQDEAREYFDTVLDIILKKLGGGDIPGPLPGCGPNPDPNNEHIKEGGWGGDMAGASQWDAVAMRDDPSLFKVVDKQGKNIAHKFASEADAEKFITYHRCKQEAGGPDPSPEPGPEPGPTPTPGPSGAGPYPALGEPMQSTQRGPTTRHYASGKPDDKTIEKNVKNIKFKNYMFVVDLTMNAIEHDDTASLKYGGTHMGSGWFDNTVGFEDGLVGLGTEKKHPSANLNVIKGGKIGNIIGKPLKIAGIYYGDINKVEMWTDFQGSGWKKQAEGTNVDNFNPKSDVDEAQLRIDGWKEQPTIRSALVYEIAAPSGT